MSPWIVEFQDVLVDFVDGSLLTKNGMLGH